MAYTLDEFCTDCRKALQSGQPIEAAVDTIADHLTKLLVNKEFVDATFKPEDDFTKKVLYHDPDLDFYVLAHVHQGPKEGPPHSHGASWAVYGTAMGLTGMKDWQRLNPVGEEGAVLRMSDKYDLGVGQSHGYGPHQIHSTWHPAKAWVVRVAGTNLDVIPRYRFKRDRDRIQEAA